MKQKAFERSLEKQKPYQIALIGLYVGAHGFEPRTLCL